MSQRQDRHQLLNFMHHEPLGKSKLKSEQDLANEEEKKVPSYKRKNSHDAARLINESENLVGRRHKQISEMQG